ncbi:MAG: TetR/AcrR family transcriptional regulator [Lachnospiraceae bacterium]
MNHVITSKEAILKASRNLVKEQGPEALNIRMVASVCGVSVGSVYNYFTSKSELVTATLNSIWYDIFHTAEPEDSFSDCVARIYQNMEQGAESYPGFFTLHSMSFLGDEKEKGKEQMNHAWSHIKESLSRVLSQDKEVRPDAFDSSFPAERFIELVFSLILASMLQQNYDSSATLEVIRRSIY